VVAMPLDRICQAHPQWGMALLEWVVRGIAQGIHVSNGSLVLHTTTCDEWIKDRSAEEHAHTIPRPVHVWARGRTWKGSASDVMSPHQPSHGTYWMVVEI
jgi:hypothetical protein